ncbi:MAG: hypothetical protein ACOYMN_06080 [Roseimicrobium sp.]
MGQQLNKVIKRRRRAAYLKRKNELAKQGVTRRAVRTVKSTTEAGEKKTVAKKAVAKKAAKVPAKKAAAKAEESAE